MSVSATQQPPNPPADRREDYSAGLRLSLLVHAGLIASVLIKSLIFPGQPISYVPTLRVDLVGLPDLVKSELNKAPKLAAPPQEAKKAEPEAPPAPPKAKAAKNTEQAAPDEMVLKPTQPDSKAREKRIKSALARLKALDKISASEAATETKAKTPGVLIKGNKISHGTSLSGDARESDQANYYDSLRSRLQENWALPVWIARQKLSAQVQIYLDSRGRIRSFRFLKLSGNAQFDNAVKQCLTDSQPFPAPPESLASSALVDGVLIGFPL